MNNANKQLFDLLVTKNFEPQALDAQGKPAASPEQATMFSFDYKGESGKDYGTVVIMFNGVDLDVFFGDNVGKSMEPEDKKGWFDGFLFQLRQFAKRNVPGTFNLQDLNKLKYSMQGQAALSEGLFESWQGKKDVSYNADATQARLMIKHKHNIGEGEARYRNIQSLFIETADGERFRLPFTKLSAGRAMLEHVRQAGKPYDIRGNHIVTIVNEMNLLSRFRRANQGKIFEGETQHLVEQATHYYETLQNNLKSLSTTRGYSKYFESWNPAALTDEDVIIEDLRHMFIEQNIDLRIEQALPLLARLQKENEMKEANIFEDWANLITEGTWAVPDTKEKQAQLVGLLSQELPVGADATNATELLYDLLGDDELFDRLEELAEQDANADAREVILNRLEELKSNSAIAQVIGQLKNPAPDTQEPVQENMNSYDMDNTPCPACHEKELTYLQGTNHCKCGACGKSFSLAGKPVSEGAGDVMFKHQDQLDRLERLRDLARRMGNTEKATTLDAEIKAIHAANPVGSQDQGHLEEFAPGGASGDEEHLRKLAKQWCEAEEDYDAQEAAEEALAKFGYGISEIEDGSEAVQLIPTGEYMMDWHDNDIIVFNPEDLNETSQVYDPFTKKMVARKPIKVKMGGGYRKTDPATGKVIDSSDPSEIGKHKDELAEGAGEFLYKKLRPSQYGGVDVVGFKEAPRNSVLSGQVLKHFIDSYETEEEARKAHPDAEGYSNKYTDPQVSLSHLPGEDDPVAGGMYPDDIDEQGMAEGAESSPVAGAIVNRIMRQRPDLLTQYGPKLINAAVDEVADYVGDVDEIGSSDVSGWVNQVERMLKENPPEAFAEQQVNKLNPEWKEYERRVADLEEKGLTRSDAQGVVDAEMMQKKPVNELSLATLRDYIKKASSSGEENSVSNLASRAAHKLATGDEDDGEADDHKSFMRSKGIHKAVDRLTQEASDTVELDPKTGKPVAWSHEGDWEKIPTRNGKPVDPRGEVTNMVGKELKKAEKIEELGPDTLKSYVAHAVSDRAMRNFDQGVDMGSSMNDRMPKFDKENSRKDDQRSSGIRKALNRLEESGMSEADILFQEIARGNVDIYDIYAHPKTNIEKFVSDQIHEKYEEVAREQGYHLDDDVEQILDRIQRELEAEYGTDDNMNIELETTGGGNFLEGWKEPTGGELNQLITDYANSIVSGWENHDNSNYDYGDEEYDKADEILGTIKAKYGDEAAEHAIKAGRSNTFGREGNTHGHSKPDRLTGGLRHGKSQDITKAGKIPKNTQNAMKNDLKRPWRDKVNGPQGVLPENTALTGQYGHSGKMEPVEGADEDMMARIKFLAGIRENDTPVENPADSNLAAMKSISSIFLR